MKTIRDVAKLAGVSSSTVSRVLNESGYVKVETKKKVLGAIEKLQFEPHAMAKGLATNKTHTIALILPDITNPFFPALARAVEERARESGYTTLLCNTDQNDNRTASWIEVVKKRFIDGVILAVQSFEPHIVEFLRRHDIPLVMMDRAPDTWNDVIIRSNNTLGAEMAFRHLQEIGCRKIAHIYGPQHIFTAIERQRGYEKLAVGYDWYTPSLQAPGEFEVEGGIAAVKRLLECHPDIDGIFSSNDLMAIGAMKALKQLGRRVPEDVAVCGFDGISITKLVDPELTTVEQPIHRLGVLAVERLIEKMNGNSNQQEIHELDVTLVVRQSTQRGVK